MKKNLFVERNNQFSVLCYRRAVEDCNENGGWWDSEEEAQAWVEEEYWIFFWRGLVLPQTQYSFYVKSQQSS
tara:strand:- start:1424 stop:1639 length:216 start_codon:yes stop_codon:yes gene_type:complete